MSCGTCAFLSVVMCGGLYWVLRHKLRALFTTLGQAGGALPARLHPETAEVGDSHHPGQHDATRQSLLDLGFQSEGRYVLPELQHTVIEGFRHAEHPVTACIYDHPQVGVWLDFVARNAQDDSLTYSTSPDLGDRDHPPWSELHRLDGTPEILWEELLERLDGDFTAVPPASFLAELTASWAREMDWRNLQGGPSRTSIRAVADKQGKTLSPDEVEEAWRMGHLQALQGLHEAFVEELERTHPEIDPLEGLVFVHDVMSRQDVIDLFADYEIDDIIPEGLGTTAREIFALANRRLATWARFVHVTTVTAPCEADVWRFVDEAVGDG